MVTHFANLIPTKTAPPVIGAGQVLLSLADGPDSPFWQTFSGRGAAVLADFASTLSDWTKVKDSVTLPVLFDLIVEEVGYKQFIDDESEEGQDRWGNVQELRRLAVEFQESERQRYRRSGWRLR